jgi:hypothetical protein
MSFSLVLLLISLPVLAVCALAIYMGMSGLEKKKEKRVKDRKALENQLIWNGMWRFVGADPVTLDKAIRFLLEDQRARVGMSDEERMKKAGMLSKYKSTLEEPEKKRYTTNNRFGNWNEWDNVPYGVTHVNPLSEPQNFMFSDFRWIA